MQEKKQILKSKITTTWNMGVLKVKSHSRSTEKEERVKNGHITSHPTSFLLTRGLT